MRTSSISPLNSCQLPVSTAPISVRIGAVVARTAESKAKRHKKILARVSPEYELSAELLELGRWIGSYYMCGWGEALRTSSFIGFREVAAKAARGYALRDVETFFGLGRKEDIMGQLAT